MLRSTMGALPSGSATAIAMLRSWTSRPMLRTFFIGPASFCGSTYLRIRNPRSKGVLVHPSCLRSDGSAVELRSGRRWLDVGAEREQGLGVARGGEGERFGVEAFQL